LANGFQNFETIVEFDIRRLDWIRLDKGNIRKNYLSGENSHPREMNCKLSLEWESYSMVRLG
jgi:hypothetical protein